MMNGESRAGDRVYGDESPDRIRRLPAAATRVLVVEDEYLIAQTIVRELELAGADVLDPVPSIGKAHEALLACNPGGAVLDINLGEQMVFPFANELMRRGLPFVFYTGYEDIAIPQSFARTPRIMKPAGGEVLLRALMEPRPGPILVHAPENDLLDVLPQLRALAKTLTGTSDAADGIVEQALRKAIASVDERPSEVAVSDWLSDLVQAAAHESGFRRMN